MIKLLILLLFFFIFNISYSQNENILDYYKLDSIFDTKIGVNFIDFKEESYIMDLFNNELLIYLPNYKDNDTLAFTKINLITYKVENLNFRIKNLSSKIKTPNLTSLSFNDSLICLYFSYQNLIVLNIKNNFILYDTILKGCPYEKIHLNGNNLFMVNSYNQHPKSCNYNTEISVFDIKNLKKIKDTFLNSVDKEFSHFNPNDWFTFSSNGNIMFTLSTKYQFTEFDSDLNVISNTKLLDSNFSKFPDELLKIYYSINKEYEPKNLIKFLRKYDSIIYRIERICYISSSEIVIIKKPSYSYISKSRYYDYFKKIDNKWIKIKSDLKESKPLKETKLFKNSIPLDSYTSNNTLFKNKFYIKFIPSSVTYFENKSKNDIQKEMIDKGEAELSYKIFVYKFKL